MHHGGVEQAPRHFFAVAFTDRNYKMRARDFYSLRGRVKILRGQRL